MYSTLLLLFVLQKKGFNVLRGLIFVLSFLYGIQITMLGTVIDHQTPRAGVDNTMA